jgi:N-acetylglutamate synthase-like GNAT family acetyltransferase
MFTLRSAVEGEQAAIDRLVRSARINPIGLDWRRFLVAVDERNQVIGCGQVKLHRDGSRELASIVVLEAWRRRGVARRLIETLMDAHGPPLWLMCRSGLTPLYGKFGFRAVAPEEAQPPYFRRMRRLAKAFELFSGRGEHLAVMTWEGSLRHGAD